MRAAMAGWALALGMRLFTGIIWRAGRTVRLCMLPDEGWDVAFILFRALFSTGRYGSNVGKHFCMNPLDVGLERKLLPVREQLLFQSSLTLSAQLLLVETCLPPASGHRVVVDIPIGRECGNQVPQRLSRTEF